MLKKRLNFALKISNGEFPVKSLKKVMITLDKLEKIILSFMQSLDRTEDLYELIENIASGNVRTALDLVRNFFGSGHVDTQKICRIFEEQNQYFVPIHEFLRAVIFGDTAKYDPNRSPIVNIFDVSQYDTKEHFLMPLALGFISNAHNRTEQGFVDIKDLYGCLQGYGYTPEQIDASIVQAHKQKLIETGARKIPRPGQMNVQTLRITPIGNYHIFKLPQMFSYIDAIIVDIPIFDADVRRQIMDAEELAERLHRAEIFITYLDNEWEKSNFTGGWFDWPSSAEALKHNIDQIRNKTLDQTKSEIP